MKWSNSLAARKARAHSARSVHASSGNVAPNRNPAPQLTAAERAAQIAAADAADARRVPHRLRHVAGGSKRKQPPIGDFGS